MSNPIRLSGSFKEHHPRNGLHSHTHYEILIISKGSGYHLINQNRYPVSHSQVYFIKPGDQHEFRPDPGSEYIFLAIDNDMLGYNSPVFLRDFEFFHAAVESLRIEDDLVQKLYQDSLEIRDEMDSDNPNKELMVASLINVLLVRLQRLFLIHSSLSSIQASIPSIVTTFFHLLSDTSFRSRKVSEYAERLFVHPNYLNVLLKEHTSKSASSWIHEQLINEASRLLRYSQLSIEQISTSLGFTSSSHFARFFKRYTVQTPHHYRKVLSKSTDK